jgi:hypothetical protein
MRQDQWLTPQLVAVLVGDVSAAFIRDQCRIGAISGRQEQRGKSLHWMILRSEAERFAATHQKRQPAPEEVSGRPCPQCRGQSRVVDVRHHDQHTKRRRECVVCRYRWNTREIDEETQQVA